MLVITRRTGEQLKIGSNIVINIVETTNKRVRLAIDAPQHISIFRSEIDPDRRPRPTQEGTSNE